MDEINKVTDLLSGARFQMNACRKESYEGGEVQGMVAFQLENDIRDRADEVKFTDYRKTVEGAFEVDGCNHAYITPLVDMKHFNWFQGSTPDTEEYLPRVAFLDEIQNLANFDDPIQPSDASEWLCPQKDESASFSMEPFWPLDESEFGNLIDSERTTVTLQDSGTIYRDVERSQWCDSGAAGALIEVDELAWRINPSFQELPRAGENSKLRFSCSGQRDISQGVGGCEKWRDEFLEDGKIDVDLDSSLCVSRDSSIFAAYSTKRRNWYAEESEEGEEVSSHRNSSSNVAIHSQNGAVSPMSVLSPETGEISDGNQLQGETHEQIEQEEANVNVNSQANNCNSNQESSTTSSCIRHSSTCVSLENFTLLEAETDCNPSAHSLGNCEQPEEVHGHSFYKCRAELAGKNVHVNSEGNTCDSNQESNTTSSCIRFTTHHHSSSCESLQNFSLLEEEIYCNPSEHSLGNYKQTEDVHGSSIHRYRAELTEENVKSERDMWEHKLDDSVDGKASLLHARVNNLLCSAGFSPIKRLTSPHEVYEALVAVLRDHQRRESLVEELMEETMKLRQAEERNAIYALKLESELEAAKKLCINMEQRSQTTVTAAEKARSALLKESQQLEAANLKLLQRYSQLEHAFRAKEKEAQKYQNKLLEVVQKEEKQLLNERKIIQSLESKIFKAEEVTKGDKRRNSGHHGIKPSQIVRFYERQKMTLETEITTLRNQVANLCLLLRERETFTSTKIPMESIFEMFRALPRIENFIENICNVVFYDGEMFLPRKQTTRTPEEVPKILMHWLDLLKQCLLL